MIVTLTPRRIRYLMVCLRWLSTAFVVFASTLFIGNYLTDHVFTKVYTASALMELPADDLVIPPEGPGPEPVAPQPEFENTMMSPDFLLSVIKQLGLDRTWSKEVSNSDEEQLPDVDALTHMGKLLRLEVVHGTNIVKITASSADPQETADIANAMAIRYKAMRDAEADLSETQGEDSLREQIAQQQKVVEERKAALEKMRQDLSIKGIYIPVGERVTEIEKADAELDARRKDLLNAQEDSNAREVLLKSVINLPDDQFISQVVDGLHGQGREKEIDTLRADISKNETEIANLLKTGAKENDPRIVALRQEDDAKHKQLHDLVSGLRRAMQIDADMSKARVALLQKEVDDLTQKVRGNSLKALEPYRAAQRELDQQQTILDGLNARLKQMEADRPITQRPVRILARAQVPEVPSQPDRHFDFIVTILTASFLSVSIASFFEIIFMFLRAGERMDN